LTLVTSDFGGEVRAGSRPRSHEGLFVADANDGAMRPGSCCRQAPEQALSDLCSSTDRSLFFSGRGSTRQRGPTRILDSFWTLGRTTPTVLTLPYLFPARPGDGEIRQPAMRWRGKSRSMKPLFDADSCRPLVPPGWACR